MQIIRNRLYTPQIGYAVPARFPCFKAEILTIIFSANHSRYSSIDFTRRFFFAILLTRRDSPLKEDLFKPGNLTFLQDWAHQSFLFLGVANCNSPMYSSGIRSFKNSTTLCPTLLHPLGPQPYIFPLLCITVPTSICKCRFSE